MEVKCKSQKQKQKNKKEVKLSNCDSKTLFILYKLQEDNTCHAKL